jgi:flagellin
MASLDITRIAGNIGALNALTSLQGINNQLAIHQTRLATGKRLNESADDPAGFSIATSFDVRRQGMQVVLNSIGDGKNLLSTAEGGLKKVQDILVKMRNKALEATGDNLGVANSAERQAVQKQLQEFTKEIDDIVRQTQWNGAQLIGTAGGSASAGSSAAVQMEFLTDVSGGVTAYNNTGYGTGGSLGVGGSSGNGLGLVGSAGYGTTTGSSANGFQIDVLDKANVAAAVQHIEDALNYVKSGIADIGTMGTRLGFKEQAITVAYTNTEAAYNRIMNADMAAEQVEASKYAILQQTSTAMLAQANAAPQFLLSLFR